MQQNVPTPYGRRLDARQLNEFESRVRITSSNCTSTQSKLNIEDSDLLENEKGELVKVFNDHGQLARRVFKGRWPLTNSEVHFLDARERFVYQFEKMRRDKYYVPESFTWAEVDNYNQPEQVREVSVNVKIRTSSMPLAPEDKPSSTSPHRINLRIQCPDGSVQTLMVNLSDTPADIKQCIANKYSIRPSKLNLIYLGQALNNEQTLEKNKVTDGGYIISRFLDDIHDDSSTMALAICHREEDSARHFHRVSPPPRPVALPTATPNRISLARESLDQLLTEVREHRAVKDRYLDKRRRKRQGRRERKRLQEANGPSQCTTTQRNTLEPPLKDGPVVASTSGQHGQVVMFKELDKESSLKLVSSVTFNTGHTKVNYQNQPEYSAYNDEELEELFTFASMRANEEKAMAMNLCQHEYHDAKVRLESQLERASSEGHKRVQQLYTDFEKFRHDALCNVELSSEAKDAKIFKSLQRLQRTVEQHNMQHQVMRKAIQDAHQQAIENVKQAYKDDIMRIRRCHNLTSLAAVRLESQMNFQRMWHQ